LAERYGEQISLAISYQQLGRLHVDSGAYALAAASFERALAIREGVLGPDHPDTIATRRVLEELGAEDDVPPYSASPNVPRV